MKVFLRINWIESTGRESLSVWARLIPGNLAKKIEFTPQDGKLKAANTWEFNVLSPETSELTIEFKQHTFLNGTQTLASATFFMHGIPMDVVSRGISEYRAASGSPIIAEIDMHFMSVHIEPFSAPVLLRKSKIPVHPIPGQTYTPTIESEPLYFIPPVTPVPEKNHPPVTNEPQHIYPPEPKSRNSKKNVSEKPPKPSSSPDIPPYYYAIPKVDVIPSV